MFDKEEVGQEDQEDMYTILRIPFLPELARTPAAFAIPAHRSPARALPAVAIAPHAVNFFSGPLLARPRPGAPRLSPQTQTPDGSLSDTFEIPR